MSVESGPITLADPQALAALGTAAIAAQTALAAVADKALSPAEAMGIVVTTMTALASYERLSGEQKKKIVLSALAAALDHAGPLAADVRDITLQMAPAAIDALIAASNGKFQFGPVRSGNCCSLL